MSRIRALFSSSAVTAAFGFAIGGVGFAIANILLARAMSAKEYGLVVLFVAITQLGSTLGPAGMDTVAIRHRLGVSSRLLVRVLMSSVPLGGLAAIALDAFLPISTLLAYLIIVSVALAALNRVGCAFLLSLERYRGSLSLLIAHNGVLLMATLVLLATKRRDVETVAAILALGYGLSAIYGWLTARRHLKQETIAVSMPALQREGFTVVAAQASTAVLNQLDRIMIPRLVSPGALGEYAATVTICGSPFNLLQSGTRQTLLPKVRNACDRTAALRHIRNEAVSVLLLAGTAAVACILLGPPIGRSVFAGQFDFDSDLVQLVVALGVLKLWHGFAVSCTQALGTRRFLIMQSIAGWLGLSVAFGFAVSLTEPSVTSVISAIAAGWVVLCSASTIIAFQAFTHWTGPSSRTPEVVDDAQAVEID